MENEIRQIIKGYILWRRIKLQYHINNQKLSFFAKKEILSTYLNSSNDGNVFILDPQGEYGKLCRAVNGEEVHIKGAGEHHVNPLDISASYDDNPVAAKVEFIRSMWRLS